MGWILLIPATVFGLSAPGAFASTTASEPNSKGLVTELPARYLMDRGFVDFGKDQATDNDIRAPLASGLSFNGVPTSASDPDLLSYIFEESFLAVLPPGEPIQVGTDAKGQESWTYPLGTELAHQVTYVDADTGARALQELRIVKKLSSDRWGLGIYTTAADGQTLRLNVDGDGVTPVRREFRALARDGTTVKVNLERMPTNSCLGCHAGIGVRRDPHFVIRSAGPCGFVPQNPELRTSWAARYLQTRGSPAFAATTPIESR